MKTVTVIYDRSDDTVELPAITRLLREIGGDDADV